LKLPPLGANDSMHYAGFSALQESAKWVFENEREAEMRHTLLSAEIARCAFMDSAATVFFETHMTSALESARIAYQLAISETSRETLKSLTDLRKSITDETSKLSDLSRQLITAVTGAIALVVGLIAARASASTLAPGWLINVVLLVAVFYVAIVAWSGHLLVKLQRQLRSIHPPKPTDPWSDECATSLASSCRAVVTRYLCLSCSAGA
jgi:hypothetical protein